MAQLLAGVRESLGRIFERSRHKPFMDATMAACALVALADEDHRLAELATRDRVLVRLRELHAFDTRKAVEVYDQYAHLITRNPEEGKRKTLELVGRLKGDHKSSERLVKICLAVGRADHAFSAHERSVVEEICRTLGLHPGDLGVYDL